MTNLEFSSFPAHQDVDFVTFAVTRRRNSFRHETTTVHSPNLGLHKQEKLYENVLRRFLTVFTNGPDTRFAACVTVDGTHEMQMSETI